MAYSLACFIGTLFAFYIKNSLKNMSFGEK